MTDREKLYELIDGFDVLSAPTDGFRHCLADYLISHGVTAQEWIPVTERLPERTGSYIVHTDRGAVCTARFYRNLPTGLEYENPHWNNSRLNKHITHWMPLPEPPKEDKT